VRPSMLHNRQLGGGLTLFFFQFLVQAGVFFVVPLFLSVVLGLSALATGARLLPLSLALLIAAVGIPRWLPDVSPRLVVRVGLLALTLGTVGLAIGIDADARPEVVSVPLVLIGVGVGALASQLGSVTVSAVPDERSSEVGGVQNTMTNLGASIGTALTGSILIASLSASFLQDIERNPAVPAQVKSQVSVKLAGGVPFLSDADLQDALSKADVSPDVATEIVHANSTARLNGLRAALGVLALIPLLALFFTPLIPAAQPRAPPANA
jgi:Na+/melibiose symporter-like transporter